MFLFVCSLCPVFSEREALVPASVIFYRQLTNESKQIQITGLANELEAQTIAMASCLSFGVRFPSTSTIISSHEFVLLEVQEATSTWTWSSWWCPYSWCRAYTQCRAYAQCRAYTQRRAYRKKHS